MGSRAGGEQMDGDGSVRLPSSPPTYVLGGERFISLLRKIHAFCMVELNKKGNLRTFKFRSNMRRCDMFFFPGTRLGESCYN